MGTISLQISSFGKNLQGDNLYEFINPRIPKLALNSMNEQSSVLCDLYLHKSHRLELRKEVFSLLPCIPQLTAKQLTSDINRYQKFLDDFYCHQLEYTNFDLYFLKYMFIAITTK